jgi:hypothetical protein
MRRLKQNTGSPHAVYRGGKWCYDNWDEEVCPRCGGRRCTCDIEARIERERKER